MNHLLDEFIFRFIFILIICLAIYLYKYVHLFMYPSSKDSILKEFHPEKNPPEALIFFSRFIGIGVIFSTFYFNLEDGFSIAFINFIEKSLLSSLLYIVSIYILESITLYNFEYYEEITKKKSYAYAIFSSAQAICIGVLIKSIIIAANSSLFLIIFLWLLIIILISITSKVFYISSKFSINKDLSQRKIAVSLSYLGFIFGWTNIISLAIKHQFVNFAKYFVQVTLTILLAIIVKELLNKAIHYIFNVKLSETEIDNSKENPILTDLEYGIYEGTTNYISCILTTVVCEHIIFDKFYFGL